MSLTVLEVGGAEGLVRLIISWMASRSLRRCSGLLMPISRWISVSDKADIIAPDLTLERHAATYHAGIPTQSWKAQMLFCKDSQTRCFIIEISRISNCSFYEHLLQERKFNNKEHLKKGSCFKMKQRHETSLHTSSHATTVAPSHAAKGVPDRRTSSSISCLYTSNYNYIFLHATTARRQWSQTAFCPPHTVEASHCSINSWTSSREAVNINSYGLWFDQTENQTQVYRCVSRHSIHSPIRSISIIYVI